MAEEVKKPEESNPPETPKQPDTPAKPEAEPETEPVSLDDLPKEEIEKLTPEKPPTKPKKKPKEEPAKEAPAPPPAAAKEKPERIPVSKDEQGQPLYYDDQGNLVTGDRLKDTQAALHRTSEMLKETQKELETYKAKEAEKKYADFEARRRCDRGRSLRKRASRSNGVLPGKRAAPQNSAMAYHAGSYPGDSQRP